MSIENQQLIERVQSAMIQADLVAASLKAILRDLKAGEQLPKKEVGYESPAKEFEPVNLEGEYNTRAISILLSEGFNELELRGFANNTPEFKKVGNNLAALSGKNRIIAQITGHAEQKQKFPVLLGWAKANSPARYKRHSPYVYQKES